MTGKADGISGVERRKRALILGYLSYRGDARIKNQARVLAENGYAVDVICLAEDLGEEVDPNLIGIRVPRYRGDSRVRYVRTYAGFFLKASIRATLLALHHRYDVAVVANMPDLLVLCALGPKLLGTRIVLDVHDPMPELYRVKFGRPPGGPGERALWMEERASGWLADRVLATHQLHARRLESAGIPARKLRVVINAPNPGIFRYSSEALKRQGNFRLVYHGTIAPRLGVEVAIRAVGLLRNAIPEVELSVIGDGEGLDGCKRLTCELQLGSRVRFTPPVAVERMPELLRGCAIGVVPNRRSAATQIMLPVKLIEYAMLGIPVVAARLDAITQYFDAGSIEFFEPDSAEDMARAIARLYSQPERCASMAREANRTALELCANWDENYMTAIS